MEDPCLSQPLLSSTNTSSILFSSSSTTTEDERIFSDVNNNFSSNFNIILRLLSVISIGIISIWANYEASKGFDIAIINDARDSQAGKRFSLLYISNDKATRIVLNTSSFVENLLYNPNYTNQTRKQLIRKITLRLTNQNITNMVSVRSSANQDEFVINICKSILLDIKQSTKSLDEAIVPVVLRGMARVWLWNDNSTAPPWFLDGMVEYISRQAGFGGTGSHGSGQFCLADNKEPLDVVKFLEFCEKHKKGFIQWLNQALRDGLNGNGSVEDTSSGKSINQFCYCSTSHGIPSQQRNYTVF